MMSRRRVRAGFSATALAGLTIGLALPASLGAQEKTDAVPIEEAAQTPAGPIEALNGMVSIDPGPEPDWDMFLGAWRSTIEPHIMYTIWAEENIPALNSTAFVNKEVEALFEEAGATYDTEFHKEKYKEIQKNISEE